MQDTREDVLLCEDTQEGIFTGIYEAYARKLNPAQVRIVAGEETELRLFSVYHTIETDADKAAKVARTMRALIGEENYMQLCMALAATSPKKAQAVFQTVVLMLNDKRNAACVLNRITNPYVHTVFTLSRKAGNEMHRLREFVRFEELDNHVLFSRIGPENDVVLYLMPHFADRFPLENFLIYDEGRKLLGVHPAKQEWYMVRDIEIDYKQLTRSEQEQKYRELFYYFCHKIAIKERENRELQRNFLPLKFREYMVEFDKNFEKIPNNNTLLLDKNPYNQYNS